MLFDRFLSFLQRLPDRSRASAERSGDDVRIAAAALLIHVLEADGSRDAAETRRLRSVLGEAYGLAGRELDKVLSAGEAADREAVDLHALTGTLKRHLDREGRQDFIRMMWEMAYADGRTDELEDTIVWRVAELIGVENHDRIALRREVCGSRR